MALDVAGNKVDGSTVDEGGFFKRDCPEEVAQQFDHAGMSARAVLHAARDLSALRVSNRLLQSGIVATPV